MATTVGARNSHAAGGMIFTTQILTLITSGTTVTITLPVGTKPRNIFTYDLTAGTIIAGGTYVASTGVWVSGTLTLNDVVEVTFITETVI